MSIYVYHVFNRKKRKKKRTHNVKRAKCLHYWTIHWMRRRGLHDDYHPFLMHNIQSALIFDRRKFHSVWTNYVRPKLEHSFEDDRLLCFDWRRKNRCMTRRWSSNDQTRISTYKIFSRLSRTRILAACQISVPHKYFFLTFDSRSGNKLMKYYREIRVFVESSKQKYLRLFIIQNLGNVENTHCYE